jgi:DNA-directed RNA polymerase subunit beta'
LYRRIINRNNRLKKLIDLNAPEVIIRNEKRMLQQAVDSLLDNSRCRRPVLGSNNRPLKSLTDMIKGKQGRFRENLLGKRVDYSARSVIVVGPNLKLYQCGLPKKIALELYQPFIIRQLKQHGYADTIKSAKRMIERREDHVWDILEEVINQHPVLLNRAPTLHRMGIQAFEPVLVEGNAIMLHPLACRGFNADFDGDQMAVHLPLSVEAQAETHVLMMTTGNIFSPSNGAPMVGPSQDMVMGNYYLTIATEDFRFGDAQKLANPIVGKFRDKFEAIMAYETGKMGLHDLIQVRMKSRPVVTDKGLIPPDDSKPSQIVVTTVGRCLFDDILCDKMPFYNQALSQKKLSRVIHDCFSYAGGAETIDLLDRIKDTGFKYATLAGLSFGLTDLKIPQKKAQIIQETEKKIRTIYRSYNDGVLTERERYNQVIDAWTTARVDVTSEMLRGLKEDKNEDGSPYLNPIYLMSDSGARGSVDQIQQLAGMRALMAKPSGEIIETPIKANFREGLTVLEYFSSTHGARKGLADTALKTANSGYLTRKLIDVGQNVIILERDCGTLQGITKTVLSRGDEVHVPLSMLIVGRTARDNIRNPITDEMVARENEVITPAAAAKIEALGLDAIRVRSALTCDSPFGVCAKCYGWDLSRGTLVEEGSAVGIIAAQSIGEPGTQLTLRTFHTGGVASHAILEREQKATAPGQIQYRDINVVSYHNDDGIEVMVALKRNGEIAILDAKERELGKFKVPYGGILSVRDGQPVHTGDVLFSWDPHRTPILAEVSGKINFVDIIEGETVQIEEQKGRVSNDDEAKVADKPVVIEHKGDKHPQVIIEDENGKILDVHYLPAGARIEVQEGQSVSAGQLLAHQPRASGGTQDITGGLPRVTEVFEARKPKDPAAMAEISGRVELRSDKRKGKMTILIRSESGMEKEHHVPRDRHLNVHAGDLVEAGDALTDGPLVPHDILRIKGEEVLQRYLIGEIQNVYRSQNVGIDDKHVEIVISQMLRKVEIESVGDSKFLPGEVVDKFAFRQENERLSRSVKVSDMGEAAEFASGMRGGLHVGDIIEKAELAKINEKVESIGGEPAKGKKPRPAIANTLLLGITKASLWSESFIAAASFQETTKVLTEASLAGRVDELYGLKENVILGHLIPAGTAFKPYLDMKVKHLVDAPIPKEFAEIRDAKDAEAKADAAVKQALGLE